MLCLMGDPDLFTPQIPSPYTYGLLLANLPQNIHIVCACYYGENQRLLYSLVVLY